MDELKKIQERLEFTIKELQGLKFYVDNLVAPKPVYSIEETTNGIVIERDVFEKLYLNYPRKMGKSEGLKKMRKQIKTLEDVESVRKAIARFRAFHEEKGTDAQYIPYFSSFMNSWRDWLEETTGNVEIAPKLHSARAEEHSNHFKTQAQMILDGKL